jgi:hypothetical protein
VNVYALAAVRREHRRVTHLAQNIDRESVPPAVVQLIEDAMLDLDDAARLLRAIVDKAARQ